MNEYESESAHAPRRRSLRSLAALVVDQIVIYCRFTEIL